MSKIFSHIRCVINTCRVPLVLWEKALSSFGTKPMFSSCYDRQYSSLDVENKPTFVTVDFVNDCPPCGYFKWNLIGVSSFSLPFLPVMTSALLQSHALDNFRQMQRNGGHVGRGVECVALQNCARYQVNTYYQLLAHILPLVMSAG